MEKTSKEIEKATMPKVDKQKLMQSIKDKKNTKTVTK